MFFFLFLFLMGHCSGANTSGVRTQQIVWLKDGVVPTVFKFPAHLQSICAPLAKKKSRCTGFPLHVIQCGTPQQQKKSCHNFRMIELKRLTYRLTYELKRVTYRPVYCVAVPSSSEEYRNDSDLYRDV